MGSMAEPDSLPAAVLHPSDPVNNLGSLHTGSPARTHFNDRAFEAGRASAPGMQSLGVPTTERHKHQVAAPAFLHVQAVAWPGESSGSLPAVSMPDLGNPAFVTQPGMITVGPASPITTPSSLAPAAPIEMGLSTSLGAGSHTQLHVMDFPGSTPFSTLDAATAAFQDTLHQDPTAAISSGTLQATTQGLPSSAVSDVSLPMSMAHMQLPGASAAAADHRPFSPPGSSAPITISSPGRRGSLNVMGASPSSLELQHRVSSIKVNVDAQCSLRTPFEAGLPASATQSEAGTPAASPSTHADGGGTQAEATPFGNVYSPGGTMRSPFFQVLQTTLSSSSLGSTIFGQVQLPGSPNMKGLALGGDSQPDVGSTSAARKEAAGHSTLTITAQGMQSHGAESSATSPVGAGKGPAGRSSQGPHLQPVAEQATLSVPQLKPQPTVASSTTSNTTNGAANDWATTTNNTHYSKAYNPMALPERAMSATAGRMPSVPNLAAMRWTDIASLNAPNGLITPAPTPFNGSPQPANSAFHQQHMLGLMPGGHMGVQGGVGPGVNMAPLTSGVSGLGTMPSTALTPAKPLVQRNSGNRVAASSAANGGVMHAPLASFPSGIVRKAAPRGATRQPVRFVALQGAVQRLVAVTGDSALAVYSCRSSVPEQNASVSKPPRLMSSLTSRHLTRSRSLQPRYSINSSSSHVDMYSSLPTSYPANCAYSFTLGPNAAGNISRPLSPVELRVTPLLAGSSATFEAANHAARSLIAPPISALAVSSGAGAHLVWSGHVDGSVRVWDTRTASPPVWNRKMGGGRPITALCVADDAARGTSGEGHVVWMCDAAGLTAAVAWRGTDARTTAASAAGHRASGEDPSTLWPVTLMHALNAVLPGSDDGVHGFQSGYSWLSQMQASTPPASAEASSPRSNDANDPGTLPRRTKWYHGLFACGKPAPSISPMDSKLTSSSRTSSQASGLLKAAAKYPASSKCMLAKQGLVIVATHGKLMHLLQASSHSLMHSAGFSSYGACTALTSMRWNAGNNSTGSNGIGGTANLRELRRRSSALYRSGENSDGANSKGVTGAPSRQRSLPGFTWRLLSSHASGTILLWDVSLGRCEIVCSISSAGMGHITGLCVSQALDVMITTHKDGRLCLWPLPSAPMVPSWDPSLEAGRGSPPLLPVIWSVTKDHVSTAASLSLQITEAVREEDGPSSPQHVAPKPSGSSAGEVAPRSLVEGSERGAHPASVLQSLLGGVSGNSMTVTQAQKLMGGNDQRQLSGPPAQPPPPPPLLQVPAWKVQTWAVDAHTSSITALSLSGACAVTASKAGGIKSWDLMDLCHQAVAAGLILVSAPQAQPASAPGQWGLAPAQSYNLGVPSVAAPMPGAGPAGPMGMPASATAAAAMGVAGNQPLSTTHSHMPQPISMTSPEHMSVSFGQGAPGPLGRALSSASLHHRSRSMAGALMDTPFMSSLHAVAAPAPNRLLGAAHRNLPGTATATPRDDKQIAGHPDLAQPHTALSRGHTSLDPNRESSMHGTPQMFGGAHTRPPSGPLSDVHLTPSPYSSTARFGPGSDVHHHLPPIVGSGRPASGANLAPPSPVHELFAARQYSQHQMHGPLQAMYQQQPGSRHHGHPPPLLDQLAFENHPAQRGMSDCHSRGNSTVPPSSMETSTSCPPPKLSNTTIATNTSIATTHSKAGSTHAGSAYDPGHGPHPSKLPGMIGAQILRIATECVPAPTSNNGKGTAVPQNSMRLADAELQAGRAPRLAAAEAQAASENRQAQTVSPSAAAIVSIARNSDEPLGRLAAAVQSKQRSRAVGSSPEKQIQPDSHVATALVDSDTPGTGRASLLPEVDSLTAVAQFTLNQLDGLSLPSVQAQPLKELKLPQLNSEDMAGRHSSDHSESPFSRSTVVMALGADLSAAGGGPVSGPPHAANAKSDSMQGTWSAAGQSQRDGDVTLPGAGSQKSPSKGAGWAATTLTGGSRRGSKGSAAGESPLAGQQQALGQQAALQETSSRNSKDMTGTIGNMQEPAAEQVESGTSAYPAPSAASSPPSMPMLHGHPGSRTRRHSTGDGFPGFISSNGFVRPPGWPAYYPAPPPGYPHAPPHPASGFGWPLHPFFYPPPLYHPALFYGMALQPAAEPVPNMLDYISTYSAPRSQSQPNSLPASTVAAPPSSMLPSYMPSASKRRSMARQGADRIPEDEELHAGSPVLGRASSVHFLGTSSEPYQSMSVQQLQGKLSASFNHYAAYSQNNPYQSAPAPPHEPAPALSRSSAMLPRRTAPPPQAATPTDRWWGAVTDSRCSSPASSPRPVLLDSHEQAAVYELSGAVTTSSWGLSATPMPPSSLAASSAPRPGDALRIAHAHSRSLEMESIGWPGWDMDPNGHPLQLREHSGAGVIHAPFSSWPPYLARNDSAQSSQAPMQSQPSDAVATLQQQPQQQEQSERTEQEARTAMQVREFTNKLALLSGSFTQRVHSRDMLAMGGLSAYADKFITKDDVKLVEEVGHGAEGTVWRGRWHHIDVAVKEMHPKSTSFNRLATLARDMQTGADTGGVLDAVVKEVQTLVDVSQHPNIVRFIGVCVEPPRIITEYYPLGSLFSMLQQARDGDQRVVRSLSWPRRLQMLHNIAAGMAYLHSRSYIHGDLRTPNIFVASDGQVKIGDFGFARLLGELEDKVNSRTTNPRWLAPEVLRTGKSSKASDVFSFAIIMWEVLTWQVPYTGYFSVQVTFNHTNDGFRPEVPPDEQLPVSKHVNTKPYRALMQECWAQDGTTRPSFSEVASRLSALMHWQHSLATARDRDKRVTRRAATTSNLHPSSPTATATRVASSALPAATAFGGAAESDAASSRAPAAAAAAGQAESAGPLPPTSPATAVNSNRSPAGSNSIRSMRRHNASRRKPLSPNAAGNGPSEPSMSRMSSMAARQAVKRDGAGSVSVLAARSLHTHALRVQKAAEAAIRAVDDPTSTDNDDSLPRAPTGFGVTGLPPRGPSIRRLSRTEAGGMSMLSRNNSMRDHEAAFVAPAMPTLRLTTSITPNATAWLAAVMGSLLAAEPSPRNSRPVSPHPGASPRAALSSLPGLSSLLSSPRDREKPDASQLMVPPASSAVGTPASARQSPPQAGSVRSRTPLPPLELPSSPTTSPAVTDNGMMRASPPLPAGTHATAQDTVPGSTSTSRAQLTVSVDELETRTAPLNPMDSSSDALSPTTPSPAAVAAILYPTPPWETRAPGGGQQGPAVDGFVGLVPVPEHPNSHASHSTVPSSPSSHMSHHSQVPTAHTRLGTPQPSDPSGAADTCSTSAGAAESLTHNAIPPVPVAADSRQTSAVQVTLSNPVVPLDASSTPRVQSSSAQARDSLDGWHAHLPEPAAPSFSLPPGSSWTQPR